MKNKIYEPLTTPYESKMNKALPWSDYPRPQFRRSSYICLNGEWDFAVSGEEEPVQYSDKILVPFPPESRLSGIGRAIPKKSYLHYKRRFSLPEGFNEGRVILHFGACDTLCRVFINGKEVAYHEGGYLPFSADITEALADGENLLYVKAYDANSHKYPYGKQRVRRGGMWYTPVSGIWQTVWLESVPENYVESLKISADMTSVKICVKGGEEHKEITVFGDKTYEWDGACIEIQPENPKLWSPESPHLYDFVLECGEDRIESYFALREISSMVVSGVPRLCLNGEPYLFNGLLDQGYFPDGIFLPATSEGFLDDILLAKSMGFNTLRKHIKIEPLIFYYLCDKHGIAVFQDMVNNSGYSFFLDTALPTVGLKSFPDNIRHKNKEAREIFKKHSLDTVSHLASHPSVLYYTVFNEGWGQFSADENYRMIKDADSSRIIDATSGWFQRHESDVDSRHVYFKPVKLSGCADRPIVISEFGGYSYRKEGHLFGEKNYGYKLFKSESDFEDAFIRLYSEEISPLIKKGISGLIYTQISDVEDETNGIVTYDRRHIKLDKDRIKPLMDSLAEQIKK